MRKLRWWDWIPIVGLFTMPYRRGNIYVYWHFFWTAIVFAYLLAKFIQLTHYYE